MSATDRPLPMYRWRLIAKSVRDFEAFAQETSEEADEVYVGIHERCAVPFLLAFRPVEHAPGLVKRSRSRARRRPSSWNARRRSRHRVATGNALRWCADSVVLSNIRSYSRRQVRRARPPSPTGHNGLPGAVSSVGRALRLHRRGRWFDPGTAHFPALPCLARLRIHGGLRRREQPGQGRRESSCCGSSQGLSC
jgi:hypothetical protein